LSALSIILALQHTYGLWDFELPCFGALHGCNHYYQSYVEYMLSLGYSLAFCGAFMSASSVAFTVFSSNLFMLIIYKYDLFRAYKIQSDEAAPSEALTRIAAIELICVNVCYFPITYAILWAYKPFQVDGNVPDAFTMAWQLMFCHFIETTAAYWNHRLLHHRLFYKRFHKKHHRFNAPSSLAAGFANSLDGICVFFIPNILGPILLRSHISVLCIQMMASIVVGVDEHCGYALPFSPYSALDAARTHDFHHSHNTGNYSPGGFIFWDWLCGTDEAFRQFNRDRAEKMSKEGAASRRHTLS
jgi:sterol desaturase/sphingolipid hydroxylase (fatty acid hydroxylase superfamily)